MLSVSTLAIQKFDMERFKLRKVYTVEVTADICNWRTWMITWTQTGLGKVYGGISRSQLQTV
jgi:hypothetical protein